MMEILGITTLALVFIAVWLMLIGALTDSDRLVYCAGIVVAPAMALASVGFILAVAR